jgi:hypothetical protein
MRRAVTTPENAALLSPTLSHLRMQQRAPLPPTQRPSLAPSRVFRPLVSLKTHCSTDGQQPLPPADAPSSVSRLVGAAGALLKAYYIPIGLLSAIIVGWNFPALGVLASEASLGPVRVQMLPTVGENTCAIGAYCVHPPCVCVCASARLCVCAVSICTNIPTSPSPLSLTGVFVISGLVLESGEAALALRSPLAIVYGLATILLVTPLLAFLALAMPLQPPQMALGLAVFCCMPTTLSTGVILTQVRRCGEAGSRMRGCVGACMRGWVSKGGRHGLPGSVGQSYYPSCSSVSHTHTPRNK